MPIDQFKIKIKEATKDYQSEDATGRKQLCDLRLYFLLVVLSSIMYASLIQVHIQYILFILKAINLFLFHYTITQLNQELSCPLHPSMVDQVVFQGWAELSQKHT